MSTRESYSRYCGARWTEQHELLCTRPAAHTGGHSYADQVDLLRAALVAIANSEIPGVSGGPAGPSLEVMEFARQALDAVGGAANHEQREKLP
jgi:hypothetical protein